MAGLVEEIQRDRLNPLVSVTNLLRKVKVAASKLGLGKVEDWVESELSGYSGDIPDYRVLYGRPEALNPYHGWIAIVSGHQQFDDTLARCELRESISSLETTVARSKTPVLRMSYSASQIATLNEIMDVQFGNMGVAISVSQAQALIDVVRNSVLDWALGLERAGITGDGYSFSTRDREKAQQSAVTYNIGSISGFAGNLGQGNTSGHITQNNVQPERLRQFIEQVEQVKQALIVAGVDPASLNAAVSGLRAESMKTSPDPAVTRSLLTDLRNAVSGAAGNLLADGVIAGIGNLLA